MNRSHYFNFVEEKLSTLATRIELRGSLNILDLHLHSEDFYLRFFNKLFCWKLENLNAIKQNTKSIDLIDNSNRIIVQVSATATAPKIKSALGDIPPKYKKYSFKFISISKDASNLRNKEYVALNGVVFNPATDIYDVKSILNIINHLETTKLKEVCEFIKQELVSDIDVNKIDSNLATVISILAKESWDEKIQPSTKDPFEIEGKIQYNNLVEAKTVISDYALHHSRVDKIYAEFDLSGVNKSVSVLDAIKRDYQRSKKNAVNADYIFLNVIERTLERIQKSANYAQIPFEELELCVNIIVVDAFVRCKIFENPKGRTNATT